ncbi:unnamed protein product [Cylindrotheca closterium]|uniref:Uncharacterized protein n=1 Tax=Cylindrotheca closterium TaxID=2856 RepID=A0AAD2GAT6_9STRA|nr:unnamed protein product [Cylindrotheca closterium]
MSPSKFRGIVNDEKKLLTELCEKWEKVLTIESESTADEAATNKEGKEVPTGEDGPPSSRTRSKTQATGTNNNNATDVEGNMDASKPATEQQSLPDQKTKPAVVIPVEDEELIGLVRATTGQGRMLLRQRFVQFESLIDDAENKTSEKPIRDDDLQGFWDMIGFQVDDMKEKFQVLEQAEANDWKLVPPETKKEPPKVASKPKAVKPSSSTGSNTSRIKKAAPTSGMKDFIAQKRREAAAARKKQLQEEAEAGN